jgi:hypothetical protein
MVDRSRTRLRAFAVGIDSQESAHLLAGDYLCNPGNQSFLAETTPLRQG